MGEEIVRGQLSSGELFGGNCLEVKIWKVIVQERFPGGKCLGVVTEEGNCH